MKAKVALAIISVFLSLILMEILVRLIKPDDYSSFFTHSSSTWTKDSANLPEIIRPSKFTGYELIPHKGEGIFKVNSLGIMDRERSVEKAKNAFRIMVLGDSVSINQRSYVGILENMLNGDNGKYKFEVWNCAVPDYNTIQECSWLKNKGLKFYPDLVILGFCLNDFEVTPILVKEGRKVVIYWPKREVARFINPFLFQHSRLYRHLIYGLLFNRRCDQQKTLYQLARDSLAQTSNLLAFKNINFFVVVFPYFKNYESYSPWEKWQYASIMKILKELNIGFLDLTVTFHKAGMNMEKVSIEDGIHMNSEGHKLAAEVILKNLFDKKFLPNS